MARTVCRAQTRSPPTNPLAGARPRLELRRNRCRKPGRAKLSTAPPAGAKMAEWDGLWWRWAWWHSGSRPAEAAAPRTRKGAAARATQAATAAMVDGLQVGQGATGRAERVATAPGGRAAMRQAARAATPPGAPLAQGRRADPAVQARPGVPSAPEPPRAVAQVPAPARRSSSPAT